MCCRMKLILHDEKCHASSDVSSTKQHTHSSPPNKTLIRNERCSNPSFVIYGRLIRLSGRVGVCNLNQRSKSQSWRIQDVLRASSISLTHVRSLLLVQISCYNIRLIFTQTRGRRKYFLARIIQHEKNVDSIKIIKWLSFPAYVGVSVIRVSITNTSPGNIHCYISLIAWPC